MKSVLPSLALTALLAAHLPAQDLKPAIVTEPVEHDSDDPAIWIHPTDPAKSLVLGTDKNTEGSLYAFDLEGRIVNRIRGLERPNNVDVLRGFPLGGKSVDIAVVTERESQRLRVFLLPDLAVLDSGDLTVFGGDAKRAPMGVALYQRPRDKAVFAIVSGKTGPAEAYLAQYRLEADGGGKLKMTEVRQFGRFSGAKEIEAVAVDAESGSVFYSDESFGVREYPADPDAENANREISVSGEDGFAKDREGISIYPSDSSNGYLIVSDQGAGQFRFFRREMAEGKRSHEFVKAIPLAAKDSDGNDVARSPLGPRFPHGMLVAMSGDRTFHFYDWDEVAKRLEQDKPDSP